MRRTFIILVVACIGATFQLQAQNNYRFAQAIAHGNVHAMDRAMKRMIHREGRSVRAASCMHPLGGAEGRIGELWSMLRKQIGITELDWDRCATKADVWPGQWTLGVLYRTKGGHSNEMLERCYTIQGGRTGHLKIFGSKLWIRRTRNDLKVIGTCNCEGYIHRQTELCDEWHLTH